MNLREAQAANRILHVLDGSILLEASELEEDIEVLVDAVTASTGLVSVVEVDDVLDALGVVVQRYADAGR